MVVRACARCKTLRVPAEFHRAKRGPMGRRSHCRDCVAVGRADYYRRNGDRERADMKRWRENNREYDRQRWAAYQERRWGEQSRAHRERLAARRASPTKRCVACGEEKPKGEFYRAGRNRAGESLTPRCKPCFDAYSLPSRLAYKARKLGVASELVDLDALLAEHGAVCHLCGGGIPDGDLHWDHVIPLSRGGAHSPDNLRPAHALCNMRKHDRTPEEYASALR